MLTTEQLVRLINAAPVIGYLLSPPATLFLLFTRAYVAGLGMSFPKKGKFFPDSPGAGVPSCGGNFAREIAAALNKASVESGVRVKTVAGWTSANERTVKNWFAGTYGPNGEHLLILARHCDQVLETMLLMMDRRELLVGHRITDMERRVRELAEALGGIKTE